MSHTWLSLFQRSFLTIGFVLSTMVPLVYGDALIPLSVDQLTALSDGIVRGKVISKTCLTDPNGRIYTEVDLQISEVWKGPQAQPPSHLTVVHGGGILGQQILQVTHQVDYILNEDLVVFYSINSLGEAVTVGLRQGKFSIYEGPLEPMVANGVSHLAVTLNSKSDKSDSSDPSLKSAPLSLKNLKEKVLHLAQSEKK